MLPPWSQELVATYESNAATQFILHGNVNDRFLLPLEKPHLGSLTDFIQRVLLPRFDVVLSYDIGNGIRVEKGGDTFTNWPAFKENPELPKAPRAAMEFLTRYFRYTANLARLAHVAHVAHVAKKPQPRTQIGCLIKAAQLLAPALPGNPSFDLNSLALLIRDWADDPLLADYPLATCLLTENLHDLHPLLTGNPRATKIKIPLPDPAQIHNAVAFLAPAHPQALRAFTGHLQSLADQLNGATLNAIDHLLKLKEYRGESLQPADLVLLKKQLVEAECQDLIEFIQSKKTLHDLQGQEGLKSWLRQDLALWEKGDLQALPMGYLICGPVGTGKTYLVECLSGEAGVPVVKLRNFRDKYVGTTEGNLEKIFRLLAALTRCYVFIDEADQTLGKRDSGSNDSGLSGRIYSMIAQEMSRAENRGRIIWILASSRPDLIEVDLKRPGRVDVKIPSSPPPTPPNPSPSSAPSVSAKAFPSPIQIFPSSNRSSRHCSPPERPRPWPSKSIASSARKARLLSRPSPPALPATKTPSPPTSSSSKSSWPSTKPPTSASSPPTSAPPQIHPRISQINADSPFPGEQASWRAQLSADELRCIFQHV